MNLFSLFLTLSFFSMGNPGAIPSESAVSPDYRERSWVEDRLLKLTRELPLSLQQAESVKRALEQEYAIAQADRRELARQSTGTQQEEMRRGRASGTSGGRSSGGQRGTHEGMGGDGTRQLPGRMGEGRINAALVERARNRYLAGDDNVMVILTDEQKIRFPEICPPRETLADTTIMMMESLDLNDTQTQRIHPILEARKAKMRSILSLDGDRSALFQAMQEAKKEYDTRIQAQLNKSQQKQFRRLNRTSQSQGRPGGGRQRMGMGR